MKASEHIKKVKNMVETHGDKDIGNPEVFYIDDSFNILDYEDKRMTRSVFYNIDGLKRSIIGLYALNIGALLVCYGLRCI